MQDAALGHGLPDLLIWEVAAVVWAFAIGGWDFFHRRIPNVLVAAATLAALGNWVVSGASPLGASGVSMVAGGGLSLLLTLPGYLMRQLGAGDVKLLLAIALLGGAAAAVASFVVGALTAGAAAGAWVLVGPRFGLPPPAGRRLPFGACLALGFAVAVLSGQTGELRWLLP